MGSPVRSLTPRLRQAIRCIVAGMTTRDASELIGISETRMSQVYRSPLGQGYALYLEALADDYVARMLALGLTPQHIASAVGGGKPPEKCKPPRKRRARRAQLQTVSDLDACMHGEGAQGPEDGA